MHLYVIYRDDRKLSKEKIVAFSLIFVVVVSLFLGWWYVNNSRPPKPHLPDTTSETQEEQPSLYNNIR